MKEEMLKQREGKEDLELRRSKLFCSAYNLLIEAASQGAIKQKDAAEILNVKPSAISVNVTKYKKSNGNYRYSNSGGRFAYLDERGLGEVVCKLINSRRSRSCTKPSEFRKLVIGEINNVRKNRGLEIMDYGWKPQTSWWKKMSKINDIRKLKAQRDNAARARAYSSIRSLISNVMILYVATHPDYNGGKEVPVSALYNVDCSTVFISKENTAYVVGKKGKKKACDDGEDAGKWEQLMGELKESLEQAEDLRTETDQPVTVQGEAPLSQGVKFLTVTCADGHLALQMAIVADDSKQDDEFSHALWPNWDGNSDLHVLSCKTRAGNQKMQEFVSNTIHDTLVEERAKREACGLALNYSKNVILTMDGEVTTLSHMVSDAVSVKFEASNIVVLKHAASTSGISQPCDLMAGYRILKAAMKDEDSWDNDIIGSATMQEWKRIARQVFTLPWLN
jgi:hypothetical protein